MPSELAVQQNAWSEGEPSFGFFRETMAVTQGEVRKLLHDPLEILGRVITPTVWILIFAPIFSGLKILAQGVLFVSVVYGVGLLWERDLGLLQKFLVSPASRAALVLGKGLAAGLRNVPQILIIYILAAVARVDLRWNILAMIGVLFMVIIGSALFCMMSMLIACILKSRERFLGVNQLLTTPLFFASNALYPLALMPPWLRKLCYFNPMTYIVDGLRTAMLAQAHSSYGLVKDFFIPIPLITILIVLTSWFYPRVEY
jgi:ABC-2 type transport system permease protein